ncbi:uncharacterized protein LOC114273077 [Camellia sinensis]|uniref:uncharacterized protein LOC114273077 n=1 Tax=Camellia sinensis TaxID=4442 RepID=UPI0010362FEB|nr:uncharacterized protein LOC114273077 [Camellia sinensis]
MSDFFPDEIVVEILQTTHQIPNPIQEQIDSMTLTATSQGPVVNDCDVAEKLSNSCVLGKGVGVKGKDLNGCTSSGQGKDLEADLIKMKAESDEGLKKLSQIKDIIMQIISKSLKPTDYSAGI